MNSLDPETREKFKRGEFDENDLRGLGMLDDYGEEGEFEHEEGEFEGEDPDEQNGVLGKS